MQIPEKEPLTKSNHTKIEPEDYEKLDDILHDTASIFKKLKQEVLVIMPDLIDPYKAYEVDGYTVATQLAIDKVIAKDTVYTFHTLWHTVYGPVKTEIHQILLPFPLPCNILGRPVSFFHFRKGKKTLKKFSRSLPKPDIIILKELAAMASPTNIPCHISKNHCP